MSDDTLTAAEALYGFAGWLTSRGVPITLSCLHDASIAAELVDEFCKANELPDPRPGWSDRLRYPIEPPPEPRHGIGSKINAPFHDEPEPDDEPERVRCPVCRGQAHFPGRGGVAKACDHCGGLGTVIPVQRELFGGEE